MKKNRMMRLASTLLILTLLTTSAVSGTFAKYTTTDSATDTARVAKWGVEVTATGDNAFAETYAADTSGVTGNTVVSSETDKNILAPGTKGDLGSLAITGTPEVMVDITATAELTLTGWTLGDSTTEYCPLIFTVGGVTYQMGATASTSDTKNVYTQISDLEEAVEAAVVNALAANDVAANEDLGRSIAVTWEWPFNENDVADDYQDDVNDTTLGDKASKGNAPTITFSCSATVTQVD